MHFSPDLNTLSVYLFFPELFSLAHENKVDSISLNSQKRFSWEYMLYFSRYYPWGVLLIQVRNIAGPTRIV